MPGDLRRVKCAAVARFSVLLVLLGSDAGERLCARDAELPADFYVVSMVRSDASPFWYHYVLDVRPDGSDSIVRYIRIAPMDPACTGAVTVKAATARLAGVSPSDLISQGNPCAIDAASVNGELRRRTRTASILDSVRFGIVATCGSRKVALHLPFPEQVKLELLRKTAPQLARWWDVEYSVKERAFGAGRVFYDFAAELQDRLQRNARTVHPETLSDRFYDTTAELQDRLQRDGQTVVPELLSGRFDAGLQPECRVGQPCRSASFRDELHEYVGPLGESGRAPKLAQAQEYRFSRYVAPKYPLLAMQARVSGIVKLELSVDTNTGEVRDIKVVSGHPIFLSAVMDAAKQWRFVPEELHRNEEHIPADLVFEWACPIPLVK
jgi:TonB family protein